MDKLQELQVSCCMNSCKIYLDVNIIEYKNISSKHIFHSYLNFFSKNHIKERETKELLEQGLYIASLVALTPALIIFFSYK